MRMQFNKGDLTCGIERNDMVPLATKDKHQNKGDRAGHTGETPVTPAPTDSTWTSAIRVAISDPDRDLRRHHLRVQGSQGRYPTMD